jgi:hypothetical protein
VGLSHAWARASNPTGSGKYVNGSQFNPQGPGQGNTEAEHTYKDWKKLEKKREARNGLPDSATVIKK